MRLNWLVSGRTLKILVLVLAFGGLVAASCSFNPGPAGSNPTGSSTGTGTTGFAGSGILGVANHTGTTGSGTGTGTGSAGSTGTNPTPDGANCGLQQYGLENVPPDLLIIEDKSGSMGNDFTDTKCMRGVMCMTKWAATVPGINMVVGATDTTIRWGLKYFSTDGGCGVADGAAVPIGAGTGPAIAMSLARTDPGGSTPTRLAINSGVAYLQTVTDPNPKFILLATDGEPNCIPGNKDAQADDSAGAVAAVTASLAAGIPVFVVGVGNVAPAIATLNMLADAGGKPQAGATHYYPVGSTDELVSVLKTIGGMIASCSFGLGSVPPDPTNVGVYANGNTAMKIPKDVTHANGWDYGSGMKSIVLYGAACDAVKSMTTKTIQAIYGCPGVIIP
jgi:hypothetical protein